MNNKKKVSIVIPCYNAAQFIKDSIDSLLNQNIENTDMEIIVVDDGSTDNSVYVVSKYFSNNKSIKLIRKKHSGIVKTVTKGLEIANGDFIALQGADDLSHPDRIKTQIEFIENKDVILTYSDLTIIDEKGDIIVSSFWDYFGITPYRGKPFEILLKGNFVSGGTMLFKRNLLQYILPIPSLLPYEDHWIAFLASLYYSIDYVTKPLVFYRKHSNNINLNLKTNDFFVKLNKKKEYLIYKLFLFKEYYYYKYFHKNR